MEGLTRFKRGDTRSDGMVFFAYDKTCRGGERWVTTEYLQEKKSASKVLAKNYRKTEKGQTWIKLYRSKVDVKEKKNAKRRTGVGKGRGKRKDAITDEQRRQYDRDWKSRRYRECPKFRLMKLARSRLRSLLKQKKAMSSRTLRVHIGCSLDELKIHIESQFTEGMTWANHGLFGWHIDHKIPLSSAGNFDELVKLLHYSNIQPLWAIDNLKKAAKMPNELAA